VLQGGLVGGSVCPRAGREKDDDDDNDDDDDDNNNDNNNNNNNNNKELQTTVILGTAHIIRKVLIYEYKTYFTCEITLDVHKM